MIYIYLLYLNYFDIKINNKHLNVHFVHVFIIGTIDTICKSVRIIRYFAINLRIIIKNIINGTYCPQAQNLPVSSYSNKMAVLIYTYKQNKMNTINCEKILERGDNLNPIKHCFLFSQFRRGKGMCNIFHDPFAPVQPVYEPNTQMFK
jgi:hypothetical protein